MKNLKITGLRAAAAVTKNLYEGCGCHVQISYNLRTGEVYADYLIGESYKVYDDKNVITAYNFHWPMTATGIKETIINAVEDHYKAA